MIELQHDRLVFSFPEVCPAAVLWVEFRRALRVPDDGQDHPLPPSRERFPLRHVDDYAARVPAAWRAHGGVMLPMYQAEALWIAFDSAEDNYRGVCYPFAVKVATGKINAVSGTAWSTGLRQHPQDYVVVPRQPWLDGYCVANGSVRQFVAMPLGMGATAEEQLTGEAAYGGLQIEAFPMKRHVFERRFPMRVCHLRQSIEVCFCEQANHLHLLEAGLGPGGRMRQKIYADPYALKDWDLEHSSRCFVHIANSMVWRQVTGENPPIKPPTAQKYAQAGLPWFLWYDEQHASLAGADKLAGLQSVAGPAQAGHIEAPAKNQGATPERVIAIGPGLPGKRVREPKG